jgi:hypothetical protein
MPEELPALPPLPLLRQEPVPALPQGSPAESPERRGGYDGCGGCGRHARTARRLKGCLQRPQCETGGKVNCSSVVNLEASARAGRRVRVHTWRRRRDNTARAYQATYGWANPTVHPVHSLTRGELTPRSQGCALEPDSLSGATRGPGVAGHVFAGHIDEAARYAILRRRRKQPLAGPATLISPHHSLDK